MDESDEYENRVEEFLQFAQQNEPEMGGVYLCPCVKCLNGQRQSLNDIRTHLGYDGISLTNIKCIWYGKLPQMSTVPPTDAVDVQVGDRIEDKLRDLGQEGFRQAHAPYYEKLETEFKKPLYLGCANFTSQQQGSHPYRMMETTNQLVSSELSQFLAHSPMRLS